MNFIQIITIFSPLVGATFCGLTLPFIQQPHTFDIAAQFDLKNTLQVQNFNSEVVNSRHADSENFNLKHPDLASMQNTHPLNEWAADKILHFAPELNDGIQFNRCFKIGRILPLTPSDKLSIKTIANNQKNNKILRYLISGQNIKYVHTNGIVICQILKLAARCHKPPKVCNKSELFKMAKQCDLGAINQLQTNIEYHRYLKFCIGDKFNLTKFNRNLIYYLQIGDQYDFIIFHKKPANLKFLDHIKKPLATQNKDEVTNFQLATDEIMFTSDANHAFNFGAIEQLAVLVWQLMDCVDGFVRQFIGLFNWFFEQFMRFIQQHVWELFYVMWELLYFEQLMWAFDQLLCVFQPLKIIMGYVMTPTQKWMFFFYQNLYGLWGNFFRIIFWGWVFKNNYVFFQVIFKHIKYFYAKCLKYVDNIFSKFLTHINNIFYGIKKVVNSEQALDSFIQYLKKCMAAVLNFPIYLITSTIIFHIKRYMYEKFKKYSIIILYCIAFMSVGYNFYRYIYPYNKI